MGDVARLQPVAGYSGKQRVKKTGMRISCVEILHDLTSFTLFRRQADPRSNMVSDRDACVDQELLRSRFNGLRTGTGKWIVTHVRVGAHVAQAFVRLEKEFVSWFLLSFI
jgi:hypothetical protein